MIRVGRPMGVCQNSFWNNWLRGKKQDESAYFQLQSGKDWRNGWNFPDRFRTAVWKNDGQKHLYWWLSVRLLQRMPVLSFFRKMRPGGWYPRDHEWIWSGRYHYLCFAFLLGRYSGPVQGIHWQMHTLVQHSRAACYDCRREKGIFHRFANWSEYEGMRKDHFKPGTLLRASGNCSVGTSGLMLRRI